MSAPTLSLDQVLVSLGSAVVSLEVAPDGTPRSIRSVMLYDAEDLAAAESGADVSVLAGVPADAARSWVHQLAGRDAAVRPVALLSKDVTPELCSTAASAGIAVVALHPRARAETVLSTVRNLVAGAAARPPNEAAPGEAFVEESDLYGLASRVAMLTGGLVSIEDDQARLLAYSATDGSADELRMLSILGREGPAEHLRRLRALGVYERVRRGSAVVEVPADEAQGWRRRLVVGIQPLGEGRARPDASLGTVWVQEGRRLLDPDSESVLRGAAAIAARMIFRARSAPSHEALQIQRLLGIRGGGVDIPSLVSALALPATGASAVVGIAALEASRMVPQTTEVAAALRLLAGAYVRESLVTATDDRLYVLVPRARPTGLSTWVGGMLDRLGGRFGLELRAAVAAPVPSLDEVAAARSEVDRVLDRPAGAERVTSLTRSRTPVLLGEIADLVCAHAELSDPRLQQLVDYDDEHAASMVDTLEQYLRRFGDVRAAAGDLHVHPNTLRYRVRRAEEILGMSLDDSDARLLLQIQLLSRGVTRTPR
ncbi:PucR family transcriptional regulator [uncultured Friedmanniella sp.]|uniref:PucR family transcriptional regulator n=1 Tax=uncultured Friedmanniella sp. TaxID=335381 RepID=UPI0035CA785E